jgi:hypothetical protein
MPDYSDLTVVKKLLEDAQSADNDERELARDDNLFVTKKNGQWEPRWWNSCKDRPRYTVDMTSPIIDIRS